MKTMKAVLEFADGKKTFAVAAALILAAIIYFWLGQMGARDAIILTLQGLGLAALRGSIAGAKKRSLLK